MNIDHLSTTWIPVVVGTVSQIFATVYSAILVLLTQRLALRNDLNTRQTLTAVHDKTAAWLGLGSALSSLWQQTKIRAATWGVTCITLYLLCVFTLHVSIQALFHVVPYNATIPTFQPTNLTNADFTANLVSSYDILLMYGQVPTIGLLENMVYDVIPSVPAATGNATVNAVLYDVQCMALQDVLWATSSGLDEESDLDNLDTYVIFYYQGIYAGSTAKIFNCSGSSDPSQTDCWAPIVIASTVSIVDSTGAEAPSSGNPWVSTGAQVLQALGNSDTATSVLMTSVQMVACGIEINYTTIDVSATTQQPLLPPARPSEVLWTSFSWPKNSTISDPRLKAAQNAPALSPASGHQNNAQMTMASINDIPASDITGPIIISGDITEVSHSSLAFEVISLGMQVFVSPTAFDIFIAEELGIVSQNRTNITLADLNHSLGKALAALHWYGRTLNYSAVHAANGIMQSIGVHDDPLIVPVQPQSVDAVGQTTVMVVVSRYQLNLSLTPCLIIGTAVSTILLLLAAILVLQPSSSLNRPTSAHPMVESAGILQITWLLGGEPHLAVVKNPELGALRAAGMFEVEMSEHGREKVYSHQNETSRSGGFESD
ncbi:hypothetical protein B0H12DRAFT_1236803 [Mycena haematopus]|nr:hypothetical protein B0H12DRAFT_1236803 [Mycena haematopus]